MAEAKQRSLWDALLEFQAEGIQLQKNAINPHFKNTYISLDALMGQVLPILNRLGIVLLQQPVSLGPDPALSTVLTLAATNESIESTMPLVLQKNDPQGQGSAITYARRYALMSILGLVADEDTDAQGVKPREVVRRTATTSGNPVENSGDANTLPSSGF